ncbi:MAG: bifunctional diaminohydroxyphosphoribosylaminopyrimidine deaminase/5-amino-6-(5-phosphoribosylamino)uracil reductase RibD, partial [Verrucomicrobiia bacterium]
MHADDAHWMRLALRLARKGRGRTSPNPMVGAVLVKAGKLIGKGWHKRAGQPHAEIEALRNAESKGINPKGATLYVTLEPCSTHGRTPPCTDALIAAKIKRVVMATIDPNPRHSGRGIDLLRHAGIEVIAGCLANSAVHLNESWNHWIRHRTPWVIVKAAMTLDGKIATANGQSKWITSSVARAYSMRLRRGVDAILVGINTVLTDDPSLTPRHSDGTILPPASRLPKRIVLDTHARTPLSARLVSDKCRDSTLIVVGQNAPQHRVKSLSQLVTVWNAPLQNGKIDLHWLLNRLGEEEITSVLVEGGGEVNASFIANKLAHRVVFLYAPKILGGRSAPKAVAGPGAADWREVLK